MLFLQQNTEAINMMYVFSDKTLIIALNEWQRRQKNGQPDNDDEATRQSAVILDFMQSEEVRNNKMIVEHE